MNKKILIALLFLCANISFACTVGPATYAYGYVTIARYTAGIPAKIQVGITVNKVQLKDPRDPSTIILDSVVPYIVIADRSNPYFIAQDNFYFIPANVSSINVLVVAQNPGITGNAAPGEINNITDFSIVGVDTVTNKQAITNGQDAVSVCP